MFIHRWTYPNPTLRDEASIVQSLSAITTEFENQLWILTPVRAYVRRPGQLAQQDRSERSTGSARDQVPQYSDGVQER